MFNQHDRPTASALGIHKLAWIACVSLLAAPLPAADFNAAALERTAADEMRATKTPGAAIGIVRGGEIVWSKGLGLANVETEQPVTPETLFRLGSTTKMFTAAALVGFAEEGKLKMNEPIGAVVPGLNPAIAALTPHQLLTHTAGFTDESVMSGLHDDAALAAYIRAMDASWLFTQPGSIYSYANPGYWIAGLACEELSGQSYGQLMQQRLFEPLGMQRTTLDPLLAMTWPLALGHEVRGGKPAIVRPQADNAATRPAGQMYSNVLELARFTTALMDGGRLAGKQVLPAAVVAKMTMSYVTRPGDGGHYGYGLMITEERGVRIWQHGGSRSGYGSTIRMAPDYKLAVIILTNRSASSLPKTATAALEMLLPFSDPANVPSKAVQPLSEKEMSELVGRYTNNRQTIELFVEGGQLVARRNGPESAGTSRPVGRTAADRLATLMSEGDDDESRVVSSFTIVRDREGRPEYLSASGRAYRRQSDPQR